MKILIQRIGKNWIVIVPSIGSRFPNKLQGLKGSGSRGQNELKFRIKPSDGSILDSRGYPRLSLDLDHPNVLNIENFRYECLTPLDHIRLF